MNIRASSSSTARSVADGSSKFDDSDFSTVFTFHGSSEPFSASRVGACIKIDPKFDLTPLRSLT